MKRASLPLAIMAVLVAASASRAETDDLWPSLKTEIFGSAPIVEDDAVVSLEAPLRAEDAAVTPITITMPAATAASVKRVHLIIDNNPSPVAATIDFGPLAGSTARHIATRVRVDRFTFIRAVAETADGRLHMTKRFVKASGGCSAPASKDAEAALNDIGRTQITARRSEGAAEATVMVRHPNFSGLQIDQTTHGYTPARFVNEIKIESGGQRVMKLETGISISENPHLRFSYDASGTGALAVTITETGGLTFTSHLKADGS